MIIYRMEAAAVICFDIEADDEDAAIAKARKCIETAYGSDDELAPLNNPRAYFNHPATRGAPFEVEIVDYWASTKEKGA